MGRRVLTAYERALEEGIEKGREEGEMKTKLETARNMKNLGLSPEIIYKSVGLLEEELIKNRIFP